MLPLKIFTASHCLDGLLEYVSAQKISDTHIEPLNNQYRIRVRQDGLLKEILLLKKEEGHALLNRIKVLSHLDIAEQRLPQDGRLHYEKFAHLDVRISTCPTVHGEKCVLRNLMAMHTPLDIDSLGLHPQQKEILLRALKEPQGLILVTGPTGSGKTMTLYSALQFINRPEINIISIEDPVEIQLKGVNQVSVHAKIGLSFAATLRTLLRQDPDVVMVGEMRDRETAEIALSAAHTGHLVFSTLHTNGALEAFMRLTSLAVDENLLFSAVKLIVAQRLVRKRCTYCAEDCDQCYQGYMGRTAIYEILEITPELKNHLLKKVPLEKLKQNLIDQGWISLREHAMQKVHEGTTSLSEVARILGSFTSTHQ